MFPNRLAGRWFAMLLALALCAAAGCGGGNPLGRHALSGNVTLDGQPLAQGNIEFAPEQAGGVSSGAAVQQGRYDIPTLKGLPPGTYRVRIFASQASSAPRTPEEATLPSEHWPGKELVASRFNTASELTAQVVDEGHNEFNFAVSSPSP